MLRCSAPVVFALALLAQSLPAMAQRPLTPDQERALKPKDEFQECETCPRMVVVPAGKFLMGSPPDEEKRQPSEGPQRSVTIVKPFAAGKFEVTFEEWRACVAGGGCEHEPEQKGQDGRHPVIDVSWKDAKQYVAWLARTTGKSYRLLTEAEWEYAARAGTMTAFYTGATISSDQANHNGEFPYGKGWRKSVRRGQAITVGNLPPNPFGLHDMHGNVMEWVEDCWAGYDKAPSDGSAVLVSACFDANDRVLRDGGWNSIPENIRSGVRNRNPAGSRTTLVGFRVARTLGQ